MKKNTQSGKYECIAYLFSGLFFKKSVFNYTQMPLWHLILFELTKAGLIFNSQCVYVIVTCVYFQPQQQFNGNGMGGNMGYGGYNMGYQGYYPGYGQQGYNMQGGYSGYGYQYGYVHQDLWLLTFIENELGRKLWKQSSSLSWMLFLCMPYSTHVYTSNQQIA